MAPSVDSNLDANSFSFWLNPSIILTSKEALPASLLPEFSSVRMDGIVVLHRYYAEYLLGSSTVDPSADKEV